MPRSPHLHLRPATPQDVPLILQFIQELADYEKLPHECKATVEKLTATLFGPRQYAEVILVFERPPSTSDIPHPTSDIPLGFALFFHNYSTWLARPGIYLEDLYIRPDHRGKGAGKALLIHLAQLAKQRDCGRIEWSVLDWNTPSIDFYKSLGAIPMDEWTTFRLTGDAITKLANTI